MDDGTSCHRGISGVVNCGESGENSRNPDEQIVSETVILVSSNEENMACGRGENGNMNALRFPDAKVNALGINNATGDEMKTQELRDDEHSCVIDVNSGDGGEKGKLGENLEGERFCRICHLSSDPSSGTTITTTVTSGLIQLGCGCKNELGIVHAHCAEAWFNLKGNRQCEICGETAKNITGVGDNRFIGEWNEVRSAASGTIVSDRGRRSWRGQPFCNFLLGCLVIAFVLPWFFHVDMF